MNKDSMFAAYFKELADEETIITDFGFTVFRVEEDHVYLKEMYIIPERRREKLALELLATVENIARSVDKNKIVVSVVPSYKDSTKRVAYMLNIGFRVLQAQDDLIFFIKEI